MYVRTTERTQQQQQQPYAGINWGVTFDHKKLAAVG